jgi:pimeloyl-ACP methyl ester carboxylesterase
MSLLHNLHGVAAIVLGFAVPFLPATGMAQNDKNAQVKDILLVHGAWVDGSSWAKVIPILESKGFRVTAVQIPLSSLGDDVAATRRALALVNGPVILVGHSYGGVVITQAGSDPKVKGLVYVSAFAPDAGDSALSLMKSSPVESPAGAQVVADSTGFTTISRKGIDEDFAEELSTVDKAVLFATQGPTSAPNGLAVPVTETAWKSRPSWTLITSRDRVIPFELQKIMAQKIGAQVTTISASHLALLAHPEDVAALIEQAARASDQNK